MTRPTRPFLDANVLFSAAYRDGSRLRRPWNRDGVELLTSGYALEEARRNLSAPERRRRLEELARDVRVVPEAPDLPLPPGVHLPEKDRPILLAALGAGATHLLTGDVTHFGELFGRDVGGVLVLRPAAFPASV